MNVKWYKCISCSSTVMRYIIYSLCVYRYYTMINIMNDCSVNDTPTDYYNIEYQYMVICIWLYIKWMKGLFCYKKTP